MTLCGKVVSDVVNFDRMCSSAQFNAEFALTNATSFSCLLPVVTNCAAAKYMLSLVLLMQLPTLLLLCCC